MRKDNLSAAGPGKKRPPGDPSEKDTQDTEVQCADISAAGPGKKKPPEPTSGDGAHTE